MTAYYNENDPSCVAILRELVRSGVIAPGDVDERSIKEVKPDDLKGYKQCHFFAGAGLWSVAARLAGWPDDRQLWTGSCPCQPFSQAGKGAGVDDQRHLWPDLYQLIRAGRPAVWMGEQVAGKAGRDWFAGVRSDLDAGGYAARAVDIPAGAVGAPHIRNRLYIVAERMADAESIGGGAGYCQIPAERNGAEPANYYAHDAVADTIDSECDGRTIEPQRGSEGRTAIGRADAGSTGITMVNAESERRGEGRPEPKVRGRWPAAASADAPGGPMGDPFDTRLERQRRDGDGAGGRSFSLGSTTATDGGKLADTAGSGRANASANYWSDSKWITCHDGKARRTKPGVCLLAYGVAGRVDLWRAAGNSIVPQVAAEVIAAYLDTEDT
jgi:DNA (cytosine-5)-methyltransferase 1